MKSIGRWKKWGKRSLWFFGGFTGCLIGFYLWQPWTFDFVPKPPPSPNPPVAPDPERLFAEGTKVLLVTAHPDDSEFYIGGSLLQLGRAGAEIVQVVCTDGDKAYYPFGDHEATARVRREEQRTASAKWNAQEVVFLKYPDGRLRATDKLVEDLISQMKRVEPDYILYFDGDHPPRFSHQDHRRAGEATERAARAFGKDVWLVRFSTSAPNYVRDITDEWAEKMELLAIHESQFYGSVLARVRGIVERNAKRDGAKLGVRFAEGFRCERLGGGVTESAEGR